MSYIYVIRHVDPETGEVLPELGYHAYNQNELIEGLMALGDWNSGAPFVYLMVEQVDTESGTRQVLTLEALASRGPGISNDGYALMLANEDIAYFNMET